MSRRPCSRRWRTRRCGCTTTGSTRRWPRTVGRHGTTRRLAALVLAGLPLAWMQIAGSGYRLARVTAFLNPDSTAAAGGYQLNQSLIAVGSGGLFGVGFGRSSLKMSYLPEPQNDFIFSIIAEEQYGQVFG